MSRSHVIENWDPEDDAQWKSGGRKTAMRNLYWSVFAEHVGFSVWTLFAVMVLFMPQDVYGLDAPDKFLVSAVVTLTGAFLRIPYTQCGDRLPASAITMSPTTWIVATPRLPPPALRPRAQPFSRWGKKALMLVMDDAKLAPPSPAIAPTTRYIQSGWPGFAMIHSIPTAGTGR